MCASVCVFEDDTSFTHLPTYLSYHAANVPLHAEVRTCVYGQPNKYYIDFVSVSFKLCCSDLENC